MQPPPGRPQGPPYRPPVGGVPPAGQSARPAGGTPGGYAAPSHPSQVQGAPAGHPGWPGGHPAAPAQPPYGAQLPAGPGVRRKKRGALRFLAGTCLVTAWLTLALSLLVAVSAGLAGASMAARGRAAASSTTYFPTPAPGGGAGMGLPDLEGGSAGLPSSGAALPGPETFLPLFLNALPALYLGSAAITLVTGIVTFLLVLGLGQACYALLDLEDQSYQMAQSLQAILARLGAGR